MNTIINLTCANHKINSTLEFNNIVYGNNMYTAVSDNGFMYTSHDCENWEKLTIPNIKINDITYGNDKYIVVGCETIEDTFNNIVMTSTNCIDWVIIEKLDIYSIRYSNGLFIGLRTKDAIVVTSPDGINWTFINNTQELQSITYYNGKYVAIDDNGTILTSPDCIKWTIRYHHYEILHDITYNYGMYIAVGNFGVILKSYEGIFWTPFFIDPPHHLYRILYCNSEFLCIDNDCMIMNLNNIIKTSEP